MTLEILLGRNLIGLDHRGILVRLPLSYWDSSFGRTQWKSVFRGGLLSLPEAARGSVSQWRRGSRPRAPIVARTGQILKAAIAAIRKSSQTRVIGVQADISRAADVQRAYDEVMKEFDKVDIIVNNAGISRAMPFEKVTDEVLLDDLEMKLFAAVRLIRLVVPQMKERRWGRIIDVLNIGLLRFTF
jgi:NAD(P)-dependent dehydrogenase (short-subunit alcohol dehydrogenase family)